MSMMAARRNVAKVALGAGVQALQGDHAFDLLSLLLLGVLALAVTYHQHHQTALGTHRAAGASDFEIANGVLDHGRQGAGLQLAQASRHRRGQFPGEGFHVAATFCPGGHGLSLGGGVPDLGLGGVGGQWEEQLLQLHFGVSAR